LIAPGAALVRENLPAIAVVEHPTAVDLERLARSGCTAAYLLFDLASLAHAAGTARQLRSLGIGATAVRGDLITDELLADFDQLLFAPGDFTARLIEHAAPPTYWRQPVVPCESWRDGGRVVRLGAVFSRSPDAGMLRLADAVGPTALAADTPPSGDERDLDALIEQLRGSAHATALLIDNGGDAARLAERLAAAGLLGGYFGSPRRPIPSAVLARAVPIYTWFDAEDCARPCPVVPACHVACAFVPVALAGESPHAADQRLRAMRRAGYAALVPRFHVPRTASTEWRTAAAYGLCQQGDLPLDGSQPLFALPGWQGSEAVARLAEWRAPNRFPAAGSNEPARPRYSLGAVRRVLTGYLGEARRQPQEWHARELVDAVLAASGDRTGLTALPQYPFVAWQGVDLRSLVERAIDARLREIADAPPALVEAMRYTALSGGKRIRPVLAAVIGLGGGAPLDAVLRAALCVEWLHTASLLQDDLPSMDDDPRRRGRASAHVRHGEGLALLASDALVAMAFGDLAELADHAAVGAARASRLVAAAARALGAGGLVGGQARDLLAQAQGAAVDAVTEIHRRKTAPLFALAGSIGATLAGLPPPHGRELETLLADLGLAFQIVDDLLDAEQAPGAVADSDARNRRASFAVALQRQSAFAMAEQLAGPLIAYASRMPMFGALADLARFTVARRE
jgi:geranylgeranyl pyrophosphate synthase